MSGVQTGGARGWRRAAVLLGLVAWLVAGIIVDNSGLDWRVAIVLWLVVAMAIVAVGTVLLVPRAPRRGGAETRR